MNYVKCGSGFRAEPVTIRLRNSHQLVPVALVLCWLLLCLPVAGAAGEHRPNIIYILADDLGYGELGCYGQTKIRTPHLDRMAAEGMRFTQHYAGSAVCAPSRCVLLTGKHTGHAYIRGNDEWPPGVDVWKDRTLEGQRPLLAAEVTIGEVLQTAGYETACIGKWGLGTFDTEGSPHAQGFDHFFGYLCQRQAHSFYPYHLWRNGAKVELPGNQDSDFWTGDDYSHDELTKEALKFIRKERSRPYFLYLPYTVPHVALHVPKDSLAEYQGQWDDPPYDGKKGYVPHPHPRACYAAMITRMDRDIGALLDLIEERGEAENTLIMFSSDNGPTYAGGVDAEFFQSAGKLRGLKGSMYEGGLRVPFIAKWTGKIEPASSSDHPSAFCDLLPTLAELAEADAPTGIDGLSLAPELLGKGKQPAHAAMYWELNRKLAVREGNWKLVRNYQRQTKSWKTELFDLEADVGEEHDLFAKNPAVAKRLIHLIDELRTESPIKKWQHPNTP